MNTIVGLTKPWVTIVEMIVFCTSDLLLYKRNRNNVRIMEIWKYVKNINTFIKGLT